MEKVINSFYTGDINQFGFGSYNSGNPNYLKILKKYPYPSTNNNNIDKYFRSPTPKNLPHTDYIPKEEKLPKITKNNPRVDLSSTIASSLREIYPEQYNLNLNYNFTEPNKIQDQNFSPPLIKMQVLEDKINKMEYLNKLEHEKNLKNLQNKYIGNGRFKDFVDNHRKEIEKMYVQNFNYQNGLNEEEEEEPIIKRRNDVKERINILRKEIEYEKELRRRQNKINKKKKKKKVYNLNDNDSYDDYSNDYYSNINETPRFKERNFYSTETSQLTTTKKNTLQNSLNKEKFITQKSILSKTNKSAKLKKISLKTGNRATDKIISEQDELNEAFDQLYNIVNDFKNEINGKFETINFNQRNNFNIFQNVLNEGGNEKIEMSIKRIINKQKVDVNKKDEIALKKRIENLIDKKINEYNIFRDEEEMKKKMFDDEMERKRLETIQKIENDRIYNSIQNQQLMVRSLTPIHIKKTKKKQIFVEDKLKSLVIYPDIKIEKKEEKKIVSSHDKSNVIEENERENTNPKLTKSKKSNLNEENEKEDKVNNTHKTSKKSYSKKNEDNTSQKAPSLNLISEKEIVSLHTPRTHQSGVDSDDLESINSLVQNKSKKSKSLSKNKNRVRSPIIEATNEDL